MGGLGIIYMYLSIFRQSSTKNDREGLSDSGCQSYHIHVLQANKKVPKMEGTCEQPLNWIKQ